MALVGSDKSEIKLLLQKLLKKENIGNLDYNILGNTEKGDGYIGDVVFAEVSGTTKEGQKTYHIVLKCSKTSQALREKFPVKEAFLNEMYFYDTVFPTFVQFQEERKIDDPFQKVPKCLGTLIAGDKELLALENFKTKGYSLWERTKPLTRKQIDMIVEEYGKLHAISIAMKHQEPEKFQQLVSGLRDIFTIFIDTTGMLSLLEDTFEEVRDLLKDDLEKVVLDKWLTFKTQIRSFFANTRQPMNGLNVIIHSDCWSNNYMHHFDVNGQPSTFVILDWQMIKYSSPICDLSYFLFACLSKEDMDDVDSILKHYYNSLKKHVTKLGSNLDSIYSFNQFLEEWLKFSKFGLSITAVIHKHSLSEKGEVPDMTVAAESGEDAFKAFMQPVKKTDDYRRRMKYIVEYVAKNGII